MSDPRRKAADDALYGEGLYGMSQAPIRAGLLSEKFMIPPPFSLLDGKDGWWTARRKAWCPPGGTVIDCFSGGSVRGIVAAVLGYRYVGNDLHIEQVEENRRQAIAIGVDPIWTCGDSRRFAEHIDHAKGDFIFSSPPYFYREHYSDLPDDLNNAPNYEAFRDGYWQAIASTVSCLRDDRFACFEVAEVRGKDGIAPDFVGDTIRGFAAAGARLYNHAIHAKPLASAAIRTNMMERSRKLVPTHEHVLVFVKGDPKRAAKACDGEI